MENLSSYLPQTAPVLCQVWMASQRRGPHHTGESGRKLLERSLSIHVQAMPPAQECARAGWYEDAEWTWGEYFDQLNYITYDYEVE